MEAAGAGNSRWRRASSVKKKKNVFSSSSFSFILPSSTTQAAPAPAKAATGRKLSQANTKKPAVRLISFQFEGWRRRARGTVGAVERRASKKKLFLILFFLFLFSSSTTQAAPAPAKAATGRKLSQANTKKPAVREISV